jgi:signal transduction histidine kinase
MKSHSLIRRATIAVLGIELACAIGLASTAIWHEREARLHALDATLGGRADSLIGAVQDAEDPQDNVKIDPDEFSPPAGDEYAVYNPDGRVVGTSNESLAVVALKSRDGIQNIRLDGHEFRVLQRRGMRIIDRFETGGVGLRRPVIVVYAVRSDHVWHEVMEATRFYVFLSLGSVALSAVLLIFLARRLLHPLHELASAASSIQPAVLRFNPPLSAMRTKELRPLAEALAQTTVRLRNAFEAEKRFISDAAHELKTAVAVVRSTIQVLGMKTRSEDEYRSGIEQILDDHQRVEDLVSRMLTLARFDEEGSAFDGQIDLGEETVRSLKGLTTYAESRGVSLKIGDCSPTLKIRMTPEALETLASNLVMNAVQHSPRGSEVLVSVRGEGQKVVLEVIDSGEGISEQNLPHVFERFFREDASRSRETGGAGLGLSICKSIVERAGGSIEIRSKKGAGTLARAQFDRA